MFKDCQIEGVKVIKLNKFIDERGFLVEIFRNDEIEKEFVPVMTYISKTKPGVKRGPHEHKYQADFFAFIGPGNFKVSLWDNREGSKTYKNRMVIFCGEDNPVAVIVPCGIVHGYQNISTCDGIVINCPNKLFKGEGKKEPVDEIRHESDENTIFLM